MSFAEPNTVTKYDIEHSHLYDGKRANRAPRYLVAFVLPASSRTIGDNADCLARFAQVQCILRIFLRPAQFYVFCNADVPLPDRRGQKTLTSSSLQLSMPTCTQRQRKWKVVAKVILGIRIQFLSLHHKSSALVTLRSPVVAYQSHSS